jgi:hypothetical protein
MALEFKSSKTFKFVIGISALFISTMAATFSVTGVASLFSGYFFSVAFMMSGLEFGKVVLASFIARYWKKIGLLLKVYFVVALIVLVTITSAGIFGYLSDGYQKTKGTYDVTQKEIVFIKQKSDLFTQQKASIDKRISTLTNSRIGQEARLDSLYSRRQISSAKSVEKYIASSNLELNELSKQSAAIGDSVSKYSLDQLSKETINATGELGPLKYLATIFNTDMDSIVKWFIFMLIFVFDPLAVLLFVALNVIIKNESELEPIANDTKKINAAVKFKNIFNKFKFMKSTINEDIPNIEVTPEGTPESTQEVTPESTQEVTPEVTPESTQEVTPEVTPESTQEVTPEVTPEVNPTLEKEHTFYHGNDTSQKVEGFHTAGFTDERIFGKKKNDDNIKTY